MCHYDQSLIRYVNTNFLRNLYDLVSFKIRVSPLKAYTLYIYTLVSIFFRYL